MEKYVEKYLTDIDELNVLTETSYTASAGSTKERVKKIQDDVLSFLILAYLSGTDAVNEMLSENIQPDSEEMDEVIYLMIEGETFEDRVAKHVHNEDLGRLKNLVNSEYHRVFNGAVFKGAENVTDNFSVISKEWFTVRDNRVRETHQYLEGMKVPLSEDFYTYDGDHAPYPGLFQNPDNNVNCRCIVRMSRDI